MAKQAKKTKSAATKESAAVKNRKPVTKKARPQPKTGTEEQAPEANESAMASVARVIDKAIHNIREKLTADDTRASVGDLVRLIQLRKEIVEEGPRQVTVRWVEEWNQSPASEE